MICQYCGSKEASVHVKNVINGQMTEIFACEECCAEHGIGTLSMPAFTIKNMFEELFSDSFPKDTQKLERCAVCGKSYRDIVKCGYVGCAECYTTFYQQLQPTIRRIHGSAVHTGKILSDTEHTQSNEQRIAELKEELKTAIEKQDYEYCAQLRDQIQALESERDE